MNENQATMTNTTGPVRQECEVYSRIVGYLRPVSQWNKGKVSEYEDRTKLTANQRAC